MQAITRKPVYGDEAEDWNRVLHIILDGNFNFCRVFVPGMIKARYGKIVNIDL
jgi:NAD(P)-dependent dehydrogenase (short-subunit alcohol dehydrogenase family)